VRHAQTNPARGTINSLRGNAQETLQTMRTARCMWIGSAVQRRYRSLMQEKQRHIEALTQGLIRVHFGPLCFGSKVAAMAPQPGIKGLSLQNNLAVVAGRDRNNNPSRENLAGFRCGVPTSNLSHAGLSSTP
jgi:hypothetical protein